MNDKERIQNALRIIGELEDVSRKQMHEILEKDENKNSKNNKEIHFFNSNDCLVKTNANKTTIVDGLNNYIIIDTDDKLMILNGENEQKLKSYLKTINQE